MRSPLRFDTRRKSAPDFSALVIGPLVPDFDMGYNRALAHALQAAGFSTEVLGFYVTTPPGLRNRLLIDVAGLAGYDALYKAYVREFNSRVRAVYAAMRPALVVVIRGSKLGVETLDAMRASVRVSWFHDAVTRSDIDAEQIRCFDGIYAQSRLGCNPRVFEILGAGGAQLVDRLPFVAEQVGQGVLSYSDRGELAQHIGEACRGDSLRQLIAKRGHELVMDAHTFGHRVQAILDRHGLPVRRVLRA
jgi:hypothetical protein